MGLPSLGALKRIDVRNIWQTEHILYAMACAKSRYIG